MTNEVKIVVYEYDDCAESLPVNADKFMVFWQDKLNLVPKEFLSAAKISLNACHGTYDDDVDLEAKVYYSRPETDQETKEREDKLLYRQSVMDRDDRMEYERLKAKFSA
jgi:hypothetical protein